MSDLSTPAGRAAALLFGDDGAPDMDSGDGASNGGGDGADQSGSGDGSGSPANATKIVAATPSRRSRRLKGRSPGDSPVVPSPVAPPAASGKKKKRRKKGSKGDDNEDNAAPTAAAAATKTGKKKKNSKKKNSNSNGNNNKKTTTKGKKGGAAVQAAVAGSGDGSDEFTIEVPAEVMGVSDVDPEAVAAAVAHRLKVLQQMPEVPKSERDQRGCRTNAKERVVVNHKKRTFSKAALRGETGNASGEDSTERVVISLSGKTKKNKSGRPWKKLKTTRTSQLIRVPAMRTHFEVRQVLKADRDRVKAEESALKARVGEQLRRDRERIKQKARAKQEREHETGAVQIIHNLTTIKKMSRKQLRNLVQKK